MPPRPARAAGRALQLVGDGLVETAPRRARDARRADRDRAAGRSPRPARGGRRGGPATLAARYAAERTSGCRKRTRAPMSIRPAASAGAASSGRDPEQLRRAPQQRHVADGLGRREQQQLPGLARQRFQLAHEALLDAAGQRHRAGQPEAAGHRRRRQPARQLQQRERVAATPRRGSGRARARRAARGSWRPAAGGRRARRCPRPPAPAARRTRDRRRRRARANTSPTRSASSRRATNASVCADTRSSHCASSTTHSSGCSSATSASRLSTASPTMNRSGGGPAASPNAVLSASRCGPGSASQAVEHRRAQRVQAGERQLHLGLDARRARDPTPRRAAPTGAPAARSCRRPPRRAGPAPGSGPRARPRPAGPAPRILADGPAGRTVEGAS